MDRAARQGGTFRATTPGCYEALGPRHAIGVSGRLSPVAVVVALWRNSGAVRVVILEECTAPTHQRRLELVFELAGFCWIR